MNINKSLLLAKQHYKNNNLYEAKELYLEILDKFPSSKVAKKELKKINSKISQVVPPNSSQDQKNNLITLYSAGLFQESIDEAIRLTKIFPNDVFLYNIMGIALKNIGKNEEAIESYKQAIKIKPDYAAAFSNMGVALINIGKNEEAIASYQQVIKIKPDADAYYNMGVAFTDIERNEEAIASYKKAIEIRPNDIDTYNNMGNSLTNIGKDEEAIISYKKAIEIKPDYVDAYSNILTTLNYSPEFKIEDYLEWANKFGEMVRTKVDNKFTNYNLSQKGDKLKVGFVSGDFRNHPVGYFLENILSHLNNIELVAYSSYDKEDELTSRIKKHFTKWTPIYGKDDKEVANIIYKDNIHILIDLSGHTPHNRLPVFAYRPAPLQVSWLGYFASTGVSEIDYFIGDNYVLPKNEEKHFTEEVYRLPNFYLCFSEPESAPIVDNLPALKNNFITFGCFNNIVKINNDVIDLWSKLLLEIPSSKLFLKTKQFADKGVQESFYQKFEDNGIDRDRLTLEANSSRTEYLATYNKIDIALDPFPFPGGTITLETLYMGVPVLTLKGDRFISHAGESIMHNIKMSEWIADDKEEYLKKALKFSSNINKLANLRINLREKILNSPVFDGEGFAKDFEKCMLTIWRKHLSNLNKTDKE